LADRAWERSAVYADSRRPGGTDDHVNTEAAAAGAGVSTAFPVCRPVGDRRFTGREVRLTHLFHQELARLIGPVLAAGPDPRAGLSPRLRQTLDCLLDGELEKPAAARLKLSRPTVHQYVGELNRRFGVGSPAELLARFVRRRADLP
jgi:DNA-binding CsgD family transcriptional regulator